MLYDIISCYIILRTLYYIILSYISSTIHITYSILCILSFVFCIKTTLEYIIYHIRYILCIWYCKLHIVPIIYSITCNYTYIIYIYIYIIAVFDNNSRVIRTQCSKQSWLVAMPPQILGFCEFPRVAGWQIRFNFSFNKKRWGLESADVLRIRVVEDFWTC